MKTVDEELQAAMDQMTSRMEDVRAVRGNRMVANLLSSFEETSMARVDFDGICEEVDSLRDLISFDTRSFEMLGTLGIEDAKESLMAVHSVFDRVAALRGSLKKTKEKIKEIWEVAEHYIRGTDLGDGCKNETSFKSLVKVSLREIYTAKCEVDTLLEIVDDCYWFAKSKTDGLSAWFDLHRHYVEHIRNRGPKGEQETYDRAKSGNSSADRTAKRRARRRS